MSDYIEIKIRQGNTKWENTPISNRIEVRDSLEAQREAFRIARLAERLVRWNWAGGSQGHYVDWAGQASHDAPAAKSEAA